ncbi:YfhO family protein [Latilactobacillus graminis]|uniref:YfhO family protein n=1 Tax=Latilactobacillus graminis TaxID=60519 RepID=A0ABX6C9C8_9LACO|nr:YfhO family protein [Latilactobacillus graminis]QFP79096.1 hypothetical protein LG542_02120 [Latilactobacillus graminis]
MTSVLTLYFSSIKDGTIFLGADKEFHLARIDTLSKLLVSGRLYTGVNPYMLNHYGYGNSLFYPDFLLYIPAILHSLGLSLAKSYVLFLSLLNFSTLTSAFLAYFYVKKSYRGALIFSFFYTFSMYRLIDLILRMAVGEAQSFIFLPWVLVGIWEILAGNQKRWTILAISMTLMLISNINATITTVIMLVFIIVFNLAKLINNKNKVIQLIKATLLATGLSAFYLLPLLEQFFDQKFYVNSHPTLDVTPSMISLKLLIEESFHNQAHAIGIGTVLIVCCVVILVRINKLSYFEKTLFITALLFLIASSTLVPGSIYDNTPLHIIQFTYRLYEPVTLMLAFCSAAILGKIHSATILSLIICIPVLITVKTTMGYHQKGYMSYLQVNQISWEKDPKSIGGFAEFLPQNAERFKNFYVKKREIKYNKSNKFMINNVKFKNGKTIFDFNGTNRTELRLPIIYYKGYQAELIGGNGEVGKPFLNNQGLVSIRAKGKGRVSVQYRATLLQVLGTVVSIVVLVSTIIATCIGNRWRKNEENLNESN